MVNYCVDTNIIIDILRGDSKVAEKINVKTSEGDGFFVTPVSLCELFRGAYGHAKSEEKVLSAESIIEIFNVLDFSIDSCKIFGQFYAKLSRSGKVTNEFDLMIASIVKANNLILITRDKKHFEGLGIKVEQW